MKILFSHYLIDEDCPPARTNRAIGHELRSLGHEVLPHRSFGPPREVRLDPAGAGGIRPLLKGKVWFAKAVARNVAMSRRDARAIREFRPDVILARQDAYCISMAMAAIRSGVPLVTYADAPVAYETRLYPSQSRWHPPGLAEALERRGLAASRAITTTSRPTARKLAEYGLGVPMWLVPNGLHPERYPELSNGRRQGLRRELGISAPLVLGFQGTFRGFHGIDRLRDIILATAHRPDIHWLLIGDGPERPALEAAVAGRVAATFLGRRPPEEVGTLLGLVDIAVAPHQFVPGIFHLSPLKIIEYAAAGCAVVAGAQGDIPWLLDEGRVGVVLEDPEIPAWTAAIEGLIDDAPGRMALGHAAREHALSRFTWHHIAERYDRVLRRALGDLDADPLDPIPEDALVPARPDSAAAAARP